jgi:peptidyl-prolyl cis-trans isomerase A (cyclophilin A)
VSQPEISPGIIDSTGPRKYKSIMKKYILIGLALLCGLLYLSTERNIERGQSGYSGHHDDANIIKVVCETTKGIIDIDVNPAWSPLAAQRFLQLVDDGFYQNTPLFRCVDNFLCQWGAVPATPNAKIYESIKDDAKKPELRNFKKGYLSFAGSGPDSRTTHIFMALGDQADSLGSQSWETPFAQVSSESFEKTVTHFTTSYGEMPPWGKGPDPQKIQEPDGHTYLTQNFPLLDYIKSCSRR